MKAVVLAAGIGSRIKSVIHAHPKPMIEIAGKPILEWNLRNIKRAGITEVLMNLHYQPESIKQHFGDGSALGLNIKYVYEPELLGTAGAIFNMKEELGDNFLVVYGDNLFHFELKDFIERCDKSVLLNMAVFEKEEVKDSGVLCFNEKGQISEFREKPNPSEIQSHWVNAAVYLCKKEVISYIDRVPMDFGRDLFPNLLKNGIPLNAVPTKEGVSAFDTPELLEHYVQYGTKRLKDSNES